MQHTKFNALTMACILTASTILSGCQSTLDKLDHINKPPPMTEVKNPITEPDYQPLTWPMPSTPAPEREYANTLWQPGARAFFRDGRASRVGDILKVNVQINDRLQFTNRTEASRVTTDNSTSAETLGLAEKASKIIPQLRFNPTALTDIAGNNNVRGSGVINRQDIITTQIAALITQRLPNGNFVIEGAQEILMNQDVREVSVSGVVRPEDIKSDNTIDSTQVAQARIVYTSRGQLSDQQKPRWGGQVIDAISPF